MVTKTKVQVDFEVGQLKQLISLAKKETQSHSDRELIEWLEWRLNNCSYQQYTADYQEIDIDDIPF